VVEPYAPLHPYISSASVEDLGQKIRRAASARLLSPQVIYPLSTFCTYHVWELGQNKVFGHWWSHVR